LSCILVLSVSVGPCDTAAIWTMVSLQRTRGGGRALNFLDSVVRTSRRARIQLGGEARDKTHLAMNLLLLLALAVPLSGLAFLSLLALLGLMTLGAVIHVLGTVRAR
jgi:hypothetical protein